MNIYNDNILCFRGCGEVATHVSKKGINFCHRNAAKCSVINPKGKPKKTRKKPTLIDYDAICDYGCGEKARYIFSNNKHCCATTGGNCSSIRKNAGVKISIAKNIIEENGKTVAENVAAKISELKYENIDEDGLNTHERSARKAADTKRNTILENGLNLHEMNGKNYSEWLKTTDGLEYLKMMSDTNKKIMNSITDEGISEAKRRAEIMVETKLNNIDENGLNSFERSHLRSRNCGMVEGVFYQSLNEFRFLKSLGNDIHKVKRGPCIKYQKDSETRRYLSDYIIGNRLYEVKSHYTLYGKDGEFLETNILKLSAAVRSGYDVYLVVDDVVIPFESFIANQNQYLSMSRSV